MKSLMPSSVCEGLRRGPGEVAFDLSHGTEVGQEGEGVRGYSRQRPAPVDGVDVGTREHPFGDL